MKWLFCSINISVLHWLLKIRSKINILQILYRCLKSCTVMTLNLIQINFSIHLGCLIPPALRVVLGLLEPLPDVIGRRQGDVLDKLTVHCMLPGNTERNNYSILPPTRNLELTRMFLDILAHVGLLRITECSRVFFSAWLSSFLQGGQRLQPRQSFLLDFSHAKNRPARCPVHGLSNCRPWFQPWCRISSPTSPKHGCHHNITCTRALCLARCTPRLSPVRPRPLKFAAAFHLLISHWRMSPVAHKLALRQLISLPRLAGEAVCCLIVFSSASGLKARIVKCRWHQGEQWQCQEWHWWFQLNRPFFFCYSC